MKYITLEELERRKKFLQDSINKTRESKDTLGEDYEIGIARNHLFEVQYLINYIKMKFDDKEEKTLKPAVCTKCKHFIKCRENSKNSITFMCCGDFCARFEEGDIEENRKWFDKYLEETYGEKK